MKYEFISKRLWDKELGNAMHYQHVRPHIRAELSLGTGIGDNGCERATELTEKYYLLKQKFIRPESGDLECWNTWEIVTACCGERLTILPCELGWKFYYATKSQVTLEDFRLDREWNIGALRV